MTYPPAQGPRAKAKDPRAKVTKNRPKGGPPFKEEWWLAEAAKNWMVQKVFDAALAFIAGLTGMLVASTSGEAILNISVGLYHEGWYQHYREYLLIPVAVFVHYIVWCRSIKGVRIGSALLLFAVLLFIGIRQLDGFWGLMGGFILFNVVLAQIAGLTLATLMILLRGIADRR